MTAMRMATVFLLACSATAALGAGFAHDENFIVYANDQPLADSVIRAASRFRKEVAQDWLGKELPGAEGRAILIVEATSAEDRAFTLPIDSSDQKFHRTWLATSREKAAGSTLKHEIAHSVLNTQFPDPLPVALEEGIASLYDDPERAAVGQQLIASYSGRRSWPALRPILESKSISARDGSAYAVMSSVAEFLLSRADRATLLQFAVDGKTSSWDHAAAEHYQFQSLDALETAWHAWASQAATAPAPIRSFGAIEGVQDRNRVPAESLGAPRRVARETRRGVF